MKNLPPISELKERMRLHRETTDWLLDDAGSYNTALGARRGIGAWPKKLVKTHVVFDPDETRTYGNISGAKLSRLAVRLVLTANHEHRFLKALRGITAAVIGPLVAYLRVNYAVTRLEEVMDRTCHPARDAGARETPGDIGNDNFEAPQKPAVLRGDRRAKPAFTWSQSPRKAYGFAEAKEEYGFDPRDTSVYWIEKRAARLRRRWERYGKENLSLEPSFESRDFVSPQDEGVGDLPDKDGMSALPDSDDLLPTSIPHAGEVRSRPSKQGEGLPDMRLQPSFESPGCARPQDEERGGLENVESDIPVRRFIPVDADYNTIWPPMELPDGPPMDTEYEPLPDKDYLAPPPIPHAEEVRSAVSKQANEMQSSCLPPSFESSDCVRPQGMGDVLPVRDSLSAASATYIPDSGDLAAPTTPHAEEQRSCPSKQGKEMQTPGLKPSFESPDCVRPQDEDMEVLLPEDMSDVFPVRDSLSAASAAHMPDKDDRAAPPNPHAEEQRSCPSKQGKEMQTPGLKPSFESPDCVRPQDEGMGVLLPEDMGDVLPVRDSLSAASVAHIPDSGDLAPPTTPHAEERQSRPSKQCKEIQDSRLQPSFESRRFAPPQDEERREAQDHPRFPNRKARRKAASLARKCRAPP